MKNFSRRSFISKSGMGLTASVALSGLSFPAFLRNMGLVIRTALRISNLDCPRYARERFSGHFENHGI